MDLTIHPSTRRPRLAPDFWRASRATWASSHLAASIAESPALLAGFDGLRRAVQSGELSAADREIAGVAVGVSSATYGVAFHSTMLAGLGVDDTEIERMRSGSRRRRPVRRRGFAQDIVVARPRSAGHHRSGDHGPHPALVLEVVAEYLRRAGGRGRQPRRRVELDEPLVPRAWG